MNGDRHDRTAVGAILLGTIGAVVLSGFAVLTLARAQPEVSYVELESKVAPPPAPEVPVPPTPPVSPQPPTAPEPAAEPNRPVFTPYSVAPRLTNQEEVMRALQEAYPQELRENGIGGSARVWFFIEANGEVQEVVLNESSGVDALDQAALKVAEIIKFTPALNRDQAVPVWISLPIRFQVR